MLYAPLIYGTVFYMFLHVSFFVTTYSFYFHCGEGECAGAERIKATKQTPTWVPFLSQPDLFYNNFPRLVSNIGTGHVVSKECPS